MRRVAITGLGIISALGSTVPEFWSNLTSNVSGIAPITLVDPTRLRFQNGAEVKNFDPTQHFQSSQQAVMDRFAQFALVAARQAIADSKLDFTSDLKSRTAIVTGSCIGGQAAQDDQFVELYRNSRDRVHLRVD